MTAARAGLAALALVVGATANGGSAVRSWIEPVTGMPFVLLPAATFTMGSPAGERWREPQEVEHAVSLSRALFMGVHEVTQEQWHTIMATRPSWFDGRAPRLPVENVSWFEVQQFLERLTARSDGSRFRLPTEAEWEYACRADARTAYGVGASLAAADANIDPRDPGDPDPRERTGGTRPVGSYRPNAWGLYDMHGNVWEWTSDPYCPYVPGPQSDPRPGCASPLKVIRGGSWRFRADSARCALRYTHVPGDRGYSIGFRIVREPHQVRSAGDAEQAEAISFAPRQARPISSTSRACADRASGLPLLPFPT
jgi:formylglycine-generating enzyme required for sulfatase activity